MINLTEEQTIAVDRIFQWLDPSLAQAKQQEFKLGGYAGTGKTTVIRRLIELAREKGYSTNIGAFTGKAVNVLQRKGIPHAQTLHSMIYDCEPLPSGGVEFHLKHKLENDPDLIIVDEASMISTDLYSDLKSFKTKLLFVGDPGQLEPVGENPNLMREPTVVLQKIHRQAEASPIITLANQVRLGSSLATRPLKDGLAIRRKAEFKIPDAANFSQVICARNATRTKINLGFRHFQSRPSSDIVVGDKLIVLRNNANYAVFNGMLVYITAIHPTLEKPAWWIVDFKDEVDREYKRIPVWKAPFKTELDKHAQPPRIDAKGPHAVWCDFGYCITCHKSQGSEWDSVLLWDEWMPPQVWDMKRWRYTGITRAAKELTICL